MATDQQLVDMLEELWASIAELGSGLDEVEWKRPTECPGWTVQDNLVHITALERFILGDPLPSEDVPEDLPHVKNDIGRANERWIEEALVIRADQPAASFWPVLPPFAPQAIKRYRRQPGQDPQQVVDKGLSEGAAHCLTWC